MRNFTWNRFPIKHLLVDWLAYTHRGEYLLDCGLDVSAMNLIRRFAALSKSVSFDSC